MSEYYFFDTYAIIELINGNPNYDFVKESVIITGVMNLVEVYYALLLENNREIVDSIIKIFNFEFLDINPQTAIESALFRYKHKKKSLSYIDCIGYNLALHNNLKFLTGDKGFRDFENVKYISKE